jgi:prepilin-type N-terminal cleavage/methylation domain-containing protein
MKLKEVLTDIRGKLRLITKLGKKDKEDRKREEGFTLDEIVKEKSFQKEKGFTLIELIAVVIIIGVLLVLVVPKILGSSNDADAKLITKSVKDIREATAMAKLKCLAAINNAGCNSNGADTENLLKTLWGDSCQVMAQNAFDITNNNAMVKDFTIQTDCQNGANSIAVTIGCASNNDICTKVQQQLNAMYGNNACPNAPTNATLNCTLPL